MCSGIPEYNSAVLKCGCPNKPPAERRPSSAVRRAHQGSCQKASLHVVRERPRGRSHNALPAGWHPPPAVIRRWALPGQRRGAAQRKPTGASTCDAQSAGRCSRRGPRCARVCYAQRGTALRRGAKQAAAAAELCCTVTLRRENACRPASGGPGATCARQHTRVIFQQHPHARGRPPGGRARADCGPMGA